MKKFITGFLFGTIGLMVLDSIQAIVSQAVELLNTKIAAKTAQEQLRVNQMVMEADKDAEPPFQIGFQPTSTQCIGYEIENPDELEWEEDE